MSTRGLFGEAAEGTLFLDEVHWLPADVQGQLLRALDSGRVRPIGGAAEQEYVVRIVAASNRDLRELSDKTSPPFLPDLRARLGDWYRVHIPPLRQRREDILPIFAGLLEKEAVLRERRWLLELKLSWRLVDELIRRPWMNNVRDLRTVAMGGLGHRRSRAGLGLRAEHQRAAAQPRRHHADRGRGRPAVRARHRPRRRQRGAGPRPGDVRAARPAGARGR